jgi:hypothetical protein
MSFIDPISSEAFSSFGGQGPLSDEMLSRSIGPGIGASIPGGGAAAAGGMGSMLAPLSMASTALGAVGTMVQGVMGFVGGQQQAKQAQQAAARASLVSGVNTQEALLRGGSTLGQAATIAAASGGGLGGSTTGVLNQIAGKTYFNARMAAYKGITEAESDEYMAKVDKDNAINSLISGFGGAAAQGVAGGLKENFRQSILQSKAAQTGEIGPYETGQLF